MVNGLGPGVEFDLIRRFLDDMPPLPDAVRVGAGDDAAVLRDGVVVSADLSVEDVHFRRGWLEPEDIGYRAGAAALSDLAAMAAEPVAVLAAVAFPPADVPAVAERVVRGLREAADAAGAALIGGDVSRSPGPMVLDVVVLGRTERPVLRSGVEPGDEIWVTGELGGAAAAVAALEAGQTPPVAAARLFRRPSPRIREALWLAEHAVLHALIDLSDGLAGDASHLSAASDVAITLAAADVPIHPDAAGDADAADGGLRLALGGGEDYELCMAAPPGSIQAVREAFTERFGLRLSRVGLARQGSGVSVLDSQGRVMDMHAFRHFEGAGGTG